MTSTLILTMNEYLYDIVEYNAL